MNKRVHAPAPLLPVLLGLVFLGVVTATGCQVDRQAFQEKIYSCSPTAENPACGTDSSGQPMACVATYQLGGRNFCASSCNSAADPIEGPASFCVPSGKMTAGRVSGSRLPACSPSKANVCGKDLACLRTDLYKDEGICMNIALCTTHGDCGDPVRSTCMGQLLKETYVSASFRNDSTYCVQAGCRANRTACSPGETCLRDVLPRDSNPSDICVPNCDSNQNCPPNYLCASKLYSKPSPNICVPGLMGLRCKSRLDCLVGECAAAGGGISVCTASCEDDNDCAKYDSEHGTLFCARGPDGKKTCQGSRAYTGGICLSNDDCNAVPGRICHWPSETGRSGYCQFPCQPDGTCQSLGGVAHMCLPQIVDPATAASKGPPGCYPGYFGLPCLADAQCMGSERPGTRDLSCIKPSADSPHKLCTAQCTNDGDCRKNRLTKEGWCPASTGGVATCLPALADDAPCERHTQCASKKCVESAGGGSKCDKTPGY